MKELLELAGIFGIASALMLLMCIVFSVMYRKNKEIPFFKRSIVCGIGAFAAAVVWFIQKTPEHHISNWPILLFPALFVLIVALVMILKGNNAYKEEQALAEERRWQEEKERKAKQNGYQNYETSGGLRTSSYAERKECSEQKSNAGRKAGNLPPVEQEHRLFPCPGSTLKSFAVFSYYIEIAASVMGGFSYAFTAWEHGFELWDILIIPAIVVGGFWAAFAFSLLLYTVGATYDHTVATRTEIRQMLLDSQKDSE